MPNVSEHGPEASAPELGRNVIRLTDVKACIPVVVVLVVGGACADRGAGATTPAASLAPTSEQMSAEVFTTDYGCGWEFAIGDEQGNWRLTIAAAVQAPIPAGHIDLEQADVVATVTFGADLFSNHCDDVIEAHEPAPRVVTEWPVVAGNFEMPTYDSSVAGPLTIVLRGAIVQTESGTILLEPIEMGHDCYGCFPG